MYNWRQAGLINNYPTPTGKVRYEESEVMKLVRQNARPISSAVLYARVSSRTQRNDVDRQLDRIRDWTKSKNIEIAYEFTEIASGLNSKRRVLNKILDLIKTGKISYLIVEHNDRLTRFGFEFIERYCNEFGCKILVAKDSGLREDIVKDLIDIIICFSSKLYGKRTSLNRAKRIVEEEIKQY